MLSSITTESLLFAAVTGLVVEAGVAAVDVRPVLLDACLLDACKDFLRSVFFVPSRVGGRCLDSFTLKDAC